MIITKKEAPASTAIELGAATKIVQDDCITISREDYDCFLTNDVKLDMIVNAIQMLRYDSDRINAVRYILGIPEEVKE
jgi:hypothetical protein